MINEDYISLFLVNIGEKNKEDSGVGDEDLKRRESYKRQTRLKLMYMLKITYHILSVKKSTKVHKDPQKTKKVIKGPKMYSKVHKGKEGPQKYKKVQQGTKCPRTSTRPRFLKE